MTPDRKKRVEQITEKLIAAKDTTPVIGACLVPLLLAGQGQEVVPSLQGGQRYRSTFVVQAAPGR